MKELHTWSIITDFDNNNLKYNNNLIEIPTKHFLLSKTV